MSSHKKSNAFNPASNSTSSLTRLTDVKSKPSASVVVFDPSLYGLPSQSISTTASVRKSRDHPSKRPVKSLSHKIVDQEFENEKSITEILARLESTEDLAHSQLDGRSRKKLQLDKLVELGAIAPKPPKTPFPILHGMRKKAAKREKRTKELERDSGIVTFKPKKIDKKNKRKRPYKK